MSVNHDLAGKKKLRLMLLLLLAVFYQAQPSIYFYGDYSLHILVTLALLTFL